MPSATSPSNAPGAPTPVVYLAESAEQEIAQLKRKVERLEAESAEIIGRDVEKSLLLSITEDLAMVRDRDDLFRTISERLRPVFHFKTAAVTIYSDDLSLYRHLLVNPSKKLREHPIYPKIVGAFYLPVAGTPDRYLLDQLREDDLHYWHTEEMAARFPRHPVMPLLLESELLHNVHIALRYQDRFIGFFHIHYTDPATVPEKQFALLRAVAKQVAVAVASILANEEVARLVEARRARADELAGSNEALARTSAWLAEQPDLTAFLGQVVIEATKQLNASAGHLITLDERSQMLRTAVFIEGGKTIPLHPLVEQMPAAAVGFFQVLQGAQRPRSFDLVSEAHLFWPGALEYLHAHALKSVYGFPITAGARMLGVLGLAFPREDAINEEQSDLVAALAHQAALAIQLTRVSNEARSKAEESAVLAERNRIARDIHDALAQALTGVAVQLESAKLFTPPHSEAQAHLAQATDLTREALTDARRSVRALRPEILDLCDLCTALEDIAERCAPKTDVSARFELHGELRALAPEIENHLFRIAQEATTNAVRHARASEVKITLSFTPEAAMLVVRDDGDGFDVSSTAARRGFGLVGMNERSASIGAQFTLTSGKGSGTTVAVTVPLSSVPGNSGHL